MEDDTIWIDEWVDELPMERMLICAQRAAIAIGLPVTLKPDGTFSIPGFDWDDHEELLTDAFASELKRMHANDLLEDMAEDGLIVSDGVSEDGEVIYVAVGT